MAADNSDRQFWERHARDYDRSMKLFGGPLPRICELAAGAVAGSGRVLEVAAGTGLITAALAPRVGRLIATDYADAMLAALQKRVHDEHLSNVECRRADISALEDPPASFDACVAANVLHLVPDLAGALAALSRVVRPGGKIVVPTYCHNETRLSRMVSRVLAALVGQPMHRRFSTASLAAAVERAGLTIARVETVPGIVPIGYVEATVPGAG